MPRMTRHKANARRNSKRLWALARAKRLLNLKKQGEPMIPDSVLKQLASLNLPANEFVYQACLEKLLRGADAT
jgi:hypothetical protein